MIPTTVPDAAVVLADGLDVIAAYGDGSSTVAFGVAAVKMLGPLLAVSATPSFPGHPSAVASLHTNGTAAVFLPGVQTLTQAASFMHGGPPLSGFSTLQSPNTVVQSYAAAGAALLASFPAAKVAQVLVVGYSLGGAAAFAMGSLSLPPVPAASIAILSAGAPKPGAAGDSRGLTSPPLFRFWFDRDPVIALPPSVPDNPFAAAAVGPFVAYNWQRQTQPAGGIAIDSIGNWTYADGGRTTVVEQGTDLAALLLGGAASPVGRHGLGNYQTLLRALASTGLKRGVTVEEDLLSKPVLVLTFPQVVQAITSALAAAEFSRRSFMVPRTIIPDGELPTVESYLGGWAVVWQGQLIVSYDDKYMAKILVRWISSMMRRAMLSQAFSSPAWIAAVTSWSENLQAVGSGYSPQPPDF